MGLEQVGLVLDAKKAFGIKFGDADDFGRSARTVGEFYDIILRLVREQGTLKNKPDVESFVWEQLAKFVSREAGNVPVESITRASRFIEDLGFG